MSFTVADFEDLTRLLEAQPEWRVRMRQLLLSGEPLDWQGDLAALRRETEDRLDRVAAALERTGQEFDRRIAELTARLDRYAEERAEAERRTDQRFAELAEERAEAERRIDQRFAELATRLDRYAEERAEAERRTDQRFAELATRLDRYAEERAEAERRIDQRFAELATRLDRYAEERAEAERRTDQRFAEIGERIDQLSQVTSTHADDIGTLKGWYLESRYRERPYAYLGRLIRRARLYTDDELLKLLDPAVERGVITEDDADEVRLADLVVRGRRRDDGTEVYLVMEVSWGVGLSDLERAVRRAHILSRVVAPVLPVVAGDGVTAEAGSRCSAEGVWLLLNGRVVAPDHASVTSG